MPLGNAFPAALVDASVRRQLIPGAVVKFVAMMNDGELHEKRFVVLHVDDQTMTCAINTQVSKFIQARPELNKCQVEMKSSSHAFMDHDSHVDCSRIREYSTNEVCAQLREHPEWILGSITIELRDEVVSGLKHSPAIPPATLSAALSSLSGI